MNRYIQSLLYGGLVRAPFKFGGVGTGGLPLPVTQAGWTALGVAAPTYIFPMQDTASPLVCTVTGEELALAGAAGPDLQIDGYPGRKAMRFDGTAQVAAHAQNTFMDIDANTSFTVAIVFRMPSTAAANRTLFGKRNSAGDLEGYSCQILATGELNIAIDSGTPTVALASSSGGGFDDNTDHAVFIVHDETNDVLRIHSDLGDWTSASTATVLTLTNAATFRFGAVPGIADSPAEGLLVSYAAIWVGTALTAADHAKWWD